nr:MAG TPA: hypothetical protein [Caudoviricetes sp.]
MSSLLAPHQAPILLPRVLLFSYFYYTPTGR